LNSDDSISIKKSQDLIKDPNLKANLIYIKSNFEIIPSTIKMLESKDYLLSEAMIKIKNAKTTLKLSKNKIGGIINAKLTTVLRKNPGYKIMKTISKILEGEIDGNYELPEDLNASDIACMKYAPINTAEVERSFSMYKNVLTDNRRNLTFEHIKELLIIQCNKVKYEFNFCFSFY